MHVLSYTICVFVSKTCNCTCFPMPCVHIYIKMMCQCIYVHACNVLLLHSAELRLFFNYLCFLLYWGLPQALENLKKGTKKFHTWKIMKFLNCGQNHGKIMEFYFFRPKSWKNHGISILRLWGRSRPCKELIIPLNTIDAFFLSSWKKFWYPGKIMEKSRKNHGILLALVCGNPEFMCTNSRWHHIVTTTVCVSTCALNHVITCLDMLNLLLVRFVQSEKGELCDRGFQYKLCVLYSIP